jgi:hypothetical protein
MSILTELFGIIEESNKHPKKPGKNHPWKKDKIRKERKNPRKTTQQSLDYLANTGKQPLKENEESEENVYQQNGYADRKEYLKSLAEDYGVDIRTVVELAKLLGPTEDFDGLVSMVEDASNMEL